MSITISKIEREYVAKSLTTIEKVKAYVELLKFRLSFLVAFSATFGYLLAIQEPINWLSFFALALGGFLISGASITINQVIEKKLDKKMDRTMNRPLPANKISVKEAIFYTLIVAFVGLLLLYIFTNILTTSLALVSMILYSFVYTPLKRVGPIAVFVGAVPGALPPLLGWTAVTGTITYEALVIFGIQFLWQFPHFWSIAWVLDEDYKKAGFKMLPSKGGKNFSSALQILIYTIILIPVSLLPFWIGITGFISLFIAFLAGIFFLLPTIKLLKEQSRKSALRIMFSSFIYLPIVQIAFLIDKI